MKTTENSILNSPQNIAQVRKICMNPFLFKLALLVKAPLNFLTGMRVRELNESTCKISVNYRWLNKNPFNSTFWAVLGMTAEACSALLVMLHTHKLKPSVAIIIGDCHAEFHKKATKPTTFVCDQGLEIAQAVSKAVETGESQELVCTSTGWSPTDEKIATFSFTWKMKARSH